MRTAYRHRGVDVHLRSGAQAHEYRAIADRIAADRPGRLLDWGCGFGQVSRLLLDRGVEVTAFDYRPDAEREGFQPLERHPEIEAYLTRDPRALPFEDGGFDSVLSCGVLEHVEDPHASLAEIRRVLRPGGAFYVYKLPNRFSYLERIARRLGMYYHGAHEHDRVYTLREAVALLEGGGFRVLEARRANMLPLTASARGGAAIWAANRALSRLPGVNALATNVDLVARR